MSEAPTVPSGSRVVDGLVVPEAGTWVADAAHSTFEFVARHLTAKVRGRFHTATVTAHVAEVPEQSTVEVEIDTASVDTHEPRRDGHLKSPDFFNVEKYPKMTFRSTGLRSAGEGVWELTGDLTMLDATRPVSFDLEFLGTSPDPWGGIRAGFSAFAEVDREDWGLNWNSALETGGWLLSKKIRLEIEVEAVRQ
ncbi:MAG TPA: YceI family protein [Actinomycetota bacterium]